MFAREFGHRWLALPLLLDDGRATAAAIVALGAGGVVALGVAMPVVMAVNACRHRARC